MKRLYLVSGMLVLGLSAAMAHHEPKHYDPLPAGQDGSCPFDHDKYYDLCKPNDRRKAAIDAGRTDPCPEPYSRIKEGGLCLPPKQ